MGLSTGATGLSARAEALRAAHAATAARTNRILEFMVLNFFPNLAQVL
jgi:hypothetical protein